MLHNFSFLRQSRFYFIATLAFFVLTVLIQLFMLHVLPIKYICTIYGYEDIMDTLGQSFQTNMGKQDMVALVNMQLDQMSGWSISSFVVNGVGEANWSPANGFNSYVMRSDMGMGDAGVQKINEIIK